MPHNLHYKNVKISSPGTQTNTHTHYKKHVHSELHSRTLVKVMPHGNTRRSIIGGDIICFVLLLFCVCYFVLMFSLFSFPLAHTSHRKHRPHVLWAEMQILSSSLGTTPTACRPVAWSVTCKISLASGHGTERSVGQGLGSQENEERGGVHLLCSRKSVRALLSFAKGCLAFSFIFSWMSIFIVDFFNNEYVWIHTRKNENIICLIASKLYPLDLVSRSDM